MGTKTVDETGAETGAETTTDEEKVDVTKADEVTETKATAEADDADVEAAEDVVEDEATAPAGVGQGAGAVVSAALGIVSLTGSWIGTVAAARETLVGQLGTAQNASVAKQIKEVYGDAWQTSALWGGVFALLALVVGVVVLARPAFGAPGRPQPAWIKSVAWGGVALGVIGLLLAVLKYTDILLGLPSAG
ncbi:MULTISPECIES: hypothetical protein [unclassified Streptomyces]|uniref:hypothetical protein n=1 Tax=unclassified Streptomyces TaxID=2593676 RepID=UPI00225787CF|nr:MULTISPECIES: hypothetical protein [unclassified Streptomyces]MCX5051234.1 hypothetical protein [Streptomyces sp. NBC_00474]MCX5061573.1 hypothetical protein [Streptomyces sp. NBC_00452]MCX5249119.1 hypothetical protein [Streptomyces sp. NBC_00201]MCX5292813.1 hypothetical protein [Streptomyces sp. NBC_00183]